MDIQRAKVVSLSQSPSVNHRYNKPSKRGYRSFQVTDISRGYIFASTRWSSILMMGSDRSAHVCDIRTLTNSQTWLLLLSPRSSLTSLLLCSHVDLRRINFQDQFWALDANPSPKCLQYILGFQAIFRLFSVDNNSLEPFTCRGLISFSSIAIKQMEQLHSPRIVERNTLKKPQRTWFRRFQKGVAPQVC